MFRRTYTDIRFQNQQALLNRLVQLIPIYTPPFYKLA